MSPQVIIGTRCHYCSRFRSPSEILSIGTGGAVMCWRCYQWHSIALEAFAGQPPPGCQECGVTFDALQESSVNGDVGMYIHPKDGLYQVLCRRCSGRYVSQRADLYRSTQFGHNQKI